MQLSKLQGNSRRHCKIINGAAGKKIRVRCKDAGFTPESLNKPFFFCEAKKENGAAGKKKYGLTPRAKRAEIFLGCTSVSAASKKKLRCYHASHLGVGRGAPTVPKTRHIFFFFCPEIFRFFFFFSPKPGFCGFETAKKHLASALPPVSYPGIQILSLGGSVCFFCPNFFFSTTREHGELYIFFFAEQKKKKQKKWRRRRKFFWVRCKCIAFYTTPRKHLKPS